MCGCFSRLCTEEDFQKLPLNTPPEMQRSDLAASVLQLKALGIDNVVKFEFPSAPPSKVPIRSNFCLYIRAVCLYLFQESISGHFSAVFVPTGLLAYSDTC